MKLREYDTNGIYSSAKEIMNVFPVIMNSYDNWNRGVLTFTRYIMFYENYLRTLTATYKSPGKILLKTLITRSFYPF